MDNCSNNNNTPLLTPGHCYYHLWFDILYNHRWAFGFLAGGFKVDSKWIQALKIITSCEHMGGA